MTATLPIEADVRVYQLYRGDPRLEPRSESYWREQLTIRDRKLVELGFVSYRDYLVSDGYRRRRRVVLDAAAGLCQDCKEDADLEIHHLHYESVGAEVEEDLIALCDRCHSEAHYGLPLSKSSYRPPPKFRFGRR